MNSTTIARPRARGALLLLAAVTAAPLAAQGQPQDPVAATRSTLEQWVATRATISKENRDWALAKESLQARMDVVRRETEALKKRIGDAESGLADAEKKRLELQADNDRQKATSAALEQRIAAYEQRLLGMLPRLPDTLREKVKPLTQRIPTGEGQAAQSLGDRYATVIGVLNEIHKWNREVTVTSEVRDVGGGTSVEVAVLYAGLGQAWYAGGNGKVAGVGVAGPSKWEWRPANELSPAITKLIAVFKNEQPATFVQLPMTVQ
jgi:hypothetical protein